MPRQKRRFARIAITLPPEVLALADRLARELDRSRSWVIAEAVRRFGASGVGMPAAPTSWVVREPAVPGFAAEVLARGRRGQLQASLALSPPERLRRAEELLELAHAVRRRTPRAQIIGFDTWEDFARWKDARRIGL
jgi:hypothetical protein